MHTMVSTYQNYMYHHQFTTTIQSQINPKALAGPNGAEGTLQ